MACVQAHPILSRDRRFPPARCRAKRLSLCGSFVVSFVYVRLQIGANGWRSVRVIEIRTAHLSADFDDK
jgi:hypothetical protein